MDRFAVCSREQRTSGQGAEARLLTRDEARRIPVNKSRDLFFICGVYLIKEDRRASSC
jgi:hypothetical protein